MDVSVIIINYNTFQLTCNCIQSVIQRTSQVHLEIILVDNASTECDADLFTTRFPGIILVKSDSNLGFAGGNNLGLQYASGENILLLNSDTVLLENSIRFIFDKCRNIPALGAATIQLIYPDGSIQFAADKFPSILAHFLMTTRLRKIFKKLYGRLTGNFNYAENFSCDYVWGAFFYFPVKNLKYMNGQLTETYFMYLEDLEWCYHFKKNQLSNFYFSGSKLVHYGVRSGSVAFKNKMLLQNHLHFVKHNYGFGYYCIDHLLFMIDHLEWKLRFGKMKGIRILNRHINNTFTLFIKKSKSLLNAKY